MVPTNEDVFRIEYVQLKNENKDRIKKIKEHAQVLHDLMNNGLSHPGDQAKYIALMKLEESVMWITKVLTAPENNS